MSYKISYAYRGGGLGKFFLLISEHFKCALLKSKIRKLFVEVRKVIQISAI